MANSFQSACVIETGLSDCYRMTIFLLKMYFCKIPTRVISYRDFQKFQNERFMNSSIVQRGNNKPFINKQLSKAIMQRIRLRQKFLKSPTNQNKLTYLK